MTKRDDRERARDRIPVMAVVLGATVSFFSWIVLRTLRSLPVFTGEFDWLEDWKDVLLVLVVGAVMGCAFWVLGDLLEPRSPPGVAFARQPDIRPGQRVRFTGHHSRYEGLGAGSTGTVIDLEQPLHPEEFWRVTVAWDGSIVRSALPSELEGTEE